MRDDRISRNKKTDKIEMAPPKPQLQNPLLKATSGKATSGTAMKSSLGRKCSVGGNKVCALIVTRDLLQGIAATQHKPFSSKDHHNGSMKWQLKKRLITQTTKEILLLNLGDKVPVEGKADDRTP